MRITLNIGGIIKGIIGLFKGRKKDTYAGSSDSYYVEEYKTIEQFKDLVMNTFSAEYEVVENFAVANIDPSVIEARPYTLAFFKDNQLVLTILFTKHNGEKNRYFLNAKRACEVRGIRCLNFFEHFPNQDDYVINRIRENL